MRERDSRDSRDSEPDRLQAERMIKCEFDYHPLLQNTTDKLVLARGYTAVGTLVVSLVFFLFAFANLYRKYARFHKECACCSRFFVDYFANPFFLLALISLLPLVSYVIILRHYSHVGAKYDDKHCKLPGYLLLWFESSETLGLAAFSVYLLLYIEFHTKKSAMLQPREYEPIMRRNRLRLGRNNYGTQQTDEVEYMARIPKATWPYWCHRGFSILVFAIIILVCGLYTCPYIVKKQGPSGEGVSEDEEFRYGLDGPWCWIKPAEAQKHFWFLEEWMYMGLGSVALLAAFAVLLCAILLPQNSRVRIICRCPKWDKTIIVPFLIFFLYFVLQFALMAVEILVRICHNSDSALWFTYAIGKPLSKILVVWAALQLMSTSYRMGGREVIVAET